MTADSRKKWLPLVLLSTALVVWAGLFAAGAYLEPAADQPQRDFRKPLIILGTMAAFLALWGLALGVRTLRRRK
jgi:hypothetical protein